MNILVDLDDVLNNLLEAWTAYLNSMYNLDMKPEDITEWDITKAFKSLTPEQIFNPLTDPKLYDNVTIRKDAKKYLPLLAQKHKIRIVTNTPVSISEYKFNKTLYNIFQFIKQEDVVVTVNKSSISGDVLIDDYIRNFDGCTCRKLLFTQPHNKDIELPDDIIRVNNWEEIYQIIGEMNG